MKGLSVCVCVYIYVPLAKPKQAKRPIRASSRLIFKNTVKLLSSDFISHFQLLRSLMLCAQSVLFNQNCRKCIEITISFFLSFLVCYTSIPVSVMNSAVNCRDWTCPQSFLWRSTFSVHMAWQKLSCNGHDWSICSGVWVEVPHGHLSVWDIRSLYRWSWQCPVLSLKMITYCFLFNKSTSSVSLSMSSLHHLSRLPFVMKYAGSAKRN